MHVLTARGIESESELPFAALHQLIRPALDHLDGLPSPQAGALRGALGLGERTADDRFLVSVAVLTLLAEFAERRPVLGLIDDAHWLDTSSTDTLLFVARRLGAEGIVLLFAARDGDGRRFDVPDLPMLELGGLGAAAAEAVGADPDALDPAEGAGLVSVHGARIDLRHPRVRSALYQAARSSERRAAHRALAEALAGGEDADRRIWHLAAAALGPDEEIA